MEADLEERINYSFKQSNLLHRALLHPSRANEERQQQVPCKDQDALRTLGDAVLKTVLCDLLMRSGCQLPPVKTGGLQRGPLAGHRAAI
jgi:ribonuclease-3